MEQQMPVHQVSCTQAQEWIEILGLKPHPEGGYYARTYASPVILSKEALPQGFSGDRPSSTAIYYLLENDNFSAFHRIKSDEMWHYYAGTCALLVEVIDQDGTLHTLRMGNNPTKGDRFQRIVSAGNWFGAHLDLDNSNAQHQFVLVGCTVTPGFNFEEFEIAKYSELAKTFPQHKQIIKRLTRS